VVVNTVVVVSLIVSTEEEGGGRTYVEEESPFTTVQSSCDVSFVDICSVYQSALSLLPYFPLEMKARREAKTYRQKSKLLDLGYYSSLQPGLQTASRQVERQ
jgi:hypothetical protein